MNPMVPASLLLLSLNAFAQSDNPDWKKELEKPLQQAKRAELAKPAKAVSAGEVAAAAPIAPSETPKLETAKDSKSADAAAKSAASAAAAVGAAAAAASAAPVTSLTSPLASNEEKTRLDKLTVQNQIDAQEFAKKLRPINEEKDETSARYNLAYEKTKLELQNLELEIRKYQLEASLADEKKRKELSVLRSEIERLAVEASLNEERKRKERAALVAENEKLRLDNDRARTELEALRLKQEASDLKIASAIRELDFQSRKYKAEAELADQRTVSLRSDLELRSKKDEWKKAADREPEYPKEPFKDGVLTISDRRIPLKGPIVYGTADFITERIDYFNNKSSELPIYIVIDRSPGGSVMEGYRILKAMQTSKAPVHVVVKQYAASMAATMASLAPKSYAYPNAIILHHQIWSFSFGNPTQQKQQLDVMNEWNRRLLSPVARRMGLSLEAMTKKMYEHNVDGDWEEFADEAVKLKWIDHVAQEIRETGTLKEPETKSDAKPSLAFGLAEESDSKGDRFVRLPRLQPYDAYFIQNRDNYYR